MGIPGEAVLPTAKPAEELTFERYKIRALLSSSGSGAGKTTGACSIPGKKLLLDFDNRSEAIAGWPNVTIIKKLLHEKDPRSPKAWDAAKRLKDEIWRAVDKEEWEYDVLIVDGISAMLRICMYWALTLDPKKGLGDSPAKQHWGPQMKHVSDWLLSMLGLPCHVVVTCHEKIMQDKLSGKLHFLPMITGTLAPEEPKWFNETYWCWRDWNKETKKYKFFWQTQGSGTREYLKSSMNQLQKYWSDPIRVDFKKAPTGFQDLLVRRFGDAAKGGE